MKSLRLFLLLVFALNLSAATITVTGTGDIIAVDGACTLREAITAANTNAASGDCPAGTPGLDQIHFAIGGGGAQTIFLSSVLPSIVDPVTIDGTTQPGFAGVPLIRVYQSFIGPGATFLVETAGGGSTFRGLAVLPDFGSGIELRSSNNVVAGNYLGHDGTVARVLTGTAVLIAGAAGSPATNNVIGGLTPADRNVFAPGHGVGAGVLATGGGIADANTIIGNFFGWNPAKTAPLGGMLGGISVVSATNTIVSGNSIVAILGPAIQITLSSGTIVQFNDIGGIDPLGNHFGGVNIDTANNTIVGAATSGGPGGNVIVGNGLHLNTPAVLR